MKKGSVKKILTPVSWINALIPKNPQRILFYSNLGFRDNIRAQYEYMIKKGYHKQYRIVCSISGGSMPGNIPPEVKVVGRGRGLLYFFISRWVFYVFGQYPIRPSRGQCVVDLWHGMPLKKIGNLRAGHEKEKYDYFTYTIATSPFFGKIMAQCFHCRPNQVLLTGQPRCDGMFGTETKPERMILWLPTYRKSDRLGEQDTDTAGVPLLQTKEEWDALNQQLEEMDYRIVIKPHPLQDRPGEIPRGSRIRWLPQEQTEREGQTVWDLFLRSAALITDYSSLYTDYLLLDRPVAFVTQDMEEYKAKRGFTVEQPESVMPGPFLTRPEDLTAFVKIVTRGEDPHRDIRRSVNELLNGSQTGEAARRILEEIRLTMQREL